MHLNFNALRLFKSPHIRAHIYVHVYIYKYLLPCRHVMGGVQWGSIILTYPPIFYGDSTVVLIPSLVFFDNTLFSLVALFEWVPLAIALWNSFVFLYTYIYMGSIMSVCLIWFNLAFFIWRTARLTFVYANCVFIILWQICALLNCNKLQTNRVYEDK